MTYIFNSILTTKEIGRFVKLFLILSLSQCKAKKKKKSIFYLKKKKKQFTGCVCMLVAQSCLTLRLHGLQFARLFYTWNSSGKNTGVGSCSLLQGNLHNPGIQPRSDHVAIAYSFSLLYGISSCECIPSIFSNSESKKLELMFRVFFDPIYCENSFFGFIQQQI